MIDTKKLEKRWFKYKFKSYLLHLIIFVGVIVFILSLFIAYNMFVEESSPIKKAVPIVPIKTKEINITTEKKVIKKIIKPKEEEEEKKIIKIDEKQLTVEPSFNFISQIKYDVTNIKPEIVKIEKKIIKQPEVQEIKEVKKREIIQHHRERERPLKIIRQKTQQDIKEVIKRFEKNHNPALSLFIARQYYEIKEYKKAYNYALITNGINNDIEESWIIFAKSLVKLNKKSIAIKMLNRYIAHSNSYRATTLLDDIYSGQFR